MDFNAWDRHLKDLVGLQAFQEITKLHVTENIFSQFMYKMLPTCNHLWAFKKAFCMQLALSGTSSLPDPPPSATAQQLQRQDCKRGHL